MNHFPHSGNKTFHIPAHNTDFIVAFRPYGNREITAGHSRDNTGQLPHRADHDMYHPFHQNRQYQHRNQPDHCHQHSDPFDIRINDLRGNIGNQNPVRPLHLGKSSHIPVNFHHLKVLMRNLFTYIPQETIIRFTEPSGNQVIFMMGQNRPVPAAHQKGARLVHFNIAVYNNTDPLQRQIRGNHPDHTRVIL